MHLKQNIIANYFGQAWVALIGIIFIPIYIRYLGTEAYGLIGVFSVLQASLTLLDLGMAPTLNREMARYSAGGRSVQSINNLLRSLEVICGSIAIIIIVITWLAAKWIATDWLKVTNLPIDQVIYSINIMAFVIAFRIIEGMYKSAVLGLQKHVLFNLINIVTASLRSLGVLGVLIFISPSIKAFFVWQAIISMLSIFIFLIVVYKETSRITVKPKFEYKSLLEIRKFSLAIAISSLLSFMLLQTDKILLSKFLSLESFGFYTIAASVSGSIYLFAVPIAQSFSPKFTELITLKKDKEIIVNYHIAAQLITTMVMPVAIILIFYAKQIIFLWTNNTVLTNEVSPIIQVLTIGSALNALMYTPYIIQLGYGWTKLSVFVNLISVLFLVPALIVIAPLYGAIGAAWAWTILNIFYLILATHFMHRRILKAEKSAWYLQDVLYPLFPAIVVVAISFEIQPYGMSWFICIAWISIAGVIALATSICSSNLLRKHILSRLLPTKI